MKILKRIIFIMLLVATFYVAVVGLMATSAWVCESMNLLIVGAKVLLIILIGLIAGLTILFLIFCICRTFEKPEEEGSKESKLDILIRKYEADAKSAKQDVRECSTFSAGSAHERLYLITEFIEDLKSLREEDE